MVEVVYNKLIQDEPMSLGEVKEIAEDTTNLVVLWDNFLPALEYEQFRLNFQKLFINLASLTNKNEHHHEIYKRENMRNIILEILPYFTDPCIQTAFDIINYCFEDESPEYPVFYEQCSNLQNLSSILKILLTAKLIKVEVTDENRALIIQRMSFMLNEIKTKLDSLTNENLNYIITSFIYVFERDMWYVNDKMENGVCNILPILYSFYANIFEKYLNKFENKVIPENPVFGKFWTIFWENLFDMQDVYCCNYIRQKFFKSIIFFDFPAKYLPELCSCIDYWFKYDEITLSTEQITQVFLFFIRSYMKIKDEIGFDLDNEELSVQGLIKVYSESAEISSIEALLDIYNLGEEFCQNNQINEQGQLFLNLSCMKYYIKNSNAFSDNEIFNIRNIVSYIFENYDEISNNFEFIAIANDILRLISSFYWMIPHEELAKYMGIVFGKALEESDNSDDIARTFLCLCKSHCRFCSIEEMLQIEPDGENYRRYFWCLSKYLKYSYVTEITGEGLINYVFEKIDSPEDFIEIGIDIATRIAVLCKNSTSINAIILEKINFVMQNITIFSNDLIEIFVTYINRLKMRGYGINIAQVISEDFFQLIEDIKFDNEYEKECYSLLKLYYMFDRKAVDESYVFDKTEILESIIKRIMDANIGKISKIYSLLPFITDELNEYCNFYGYIGTEIYPNAYIEIAEFYASQLNNLEAPFIRDMINDSQKLLNSIEGIKENTASYEELTSYIILGYAYYNLMCAQQTEVNFQAFMGEKAIEDEEYMISDLQETLMIAIQAFPDLAANIGCETNYFRLYINNKITMENLTQEVIDAAKENINDPSNASLLFVLCAQNNDISGVETLIMNFPYKSFNNTFVDALIYGIQFSSNAILNDNAIFHLLEILFSDTLSLYKIPVDKFMNILRSVPVDQMQRVLTAISESYPCANQRFNEYLTSHQN